MKTGWTRLGAIFAISASGLLACGGDESIEPEPAGETESLSTNVSTVQQALTPVPGCADAVFNGHDYRYCYDFVPWQEARNRCLSYGLDLARIEDAAENNFVALIGNPFLPRWIGANDRATENTWAWSADGAPFWQGTAIFGSPIGGAYENFPPWEPVPDGGALDCANIRPFTGGSWFTTHCLEYSTFVCETFDECPNDPDKTEPGQCGCSIPDVDFDNDGTADCVDACPADPDKAQPGQCGCGRPDIDTDTDGLANCVDGCPNDFTNAACLKNDELPDPVSIPEQPGSNPIPDRDFDPNNCTPETGALSQSAPANGDAILAGTPAGGFACGQLFDPGACPLDPAQVDIRTCTTDADCSTLGPQYRCDYGIPTAPCSGMNPPPELCSNKTRRCGVPQADCLADEAPDGCTDPATCPCINPNSPSCPCTELDVCPEPDYTGTSAPEPGAYAPEVFPTPQAIADERVDPPEPVYTDPRDGVPGMGCRRPPTSGSCWCALGMDNPGPVPSVQNKPGNHGNGSLLKLSFNPEVDFEVDLRPLPFGDTAFTANAGARFVASAEVNLPLISESVDIVDLNAGVRATRCSLSTAGAHFKVFGIDFVDLFSNDPFDTSSDLNAETNACNSGISDFEEAGDRAKKTLRDAQLLIEKYRALPAGQTFDRASFCSEIGTSADPGFPAGSCLTDPIETTINRYVAHYNNQIANLRSEIQQFAQVSDDLVRALDGLAPSSSIRFLDFGRDETTELANFQFFVGPIPVNITLDVGLNYGVDGDLVFRYSPASGLGLAPGATTQLMAVAGKLIPAAAATFQVFAGVGIDLGVVAVKAGIAGSLTLASIQANLESGVGLSMSAQEDERDIPPDLLALGTGSKLFPTKEYEFFIDWFYGAKLALTDVLAGQLSAQVRLKALFFRKTFRKPFLHFDSPFNLPETTLISGGSRLPGIVLPGPSNTPENSLGVFEMELPFVDIAPLPPAVGSPAPVAMLDLEDNELHFDDVCNTPPVP